MQTGREGPDSPRFRVVSQVIAQTKFQYGGGSAALRSTMLALSCWGLQVCLALPGAGAALGLPGQAGWGEATA